MYYLYTMMYSIINLNFSHICMIYGLLTADLGLFT